MTLSPFADSAPGYAREGFRVFRINPGRKTGGARWVHGPSTEVATSDAGEIARRARRYPGSNIGIATGNGRVVLDIDTDAGGTRPEWAVPTREASTPSGGLHCWYRTDERVTNSASKIAVGVDVRGDGGMVLAAPSRTEDGAYAWITDPREPLAFVPAWRFRVFAVTRDAVTGRPITHRERRRPEDVTEGERHTQLVLWSNYFFNEYGPDLAEDLTWQFNDRLAEPKDDKEVASIIKWAAQCAAKREAKILAELDKETA